MDFRTKPISREKIRVIAYWVRTYLFKCKNKYYFDVINALELMPYKFNNVTVIIVPDDEPDLEDVPASTLLDFEGNYIIKIKETVYDGAYYRKNGGYRNHIMHEIAHVILFMLGFFPYFDVAYGNRDLKPYESIEWYIERAKERAAQLESEVTSLDRYLVP